MKNRDRSSRVLLKNLLEGRSDQEQPDLQKLRRFALSIGLVLITYSVARSPRTPRRPPLRKPQPPAVANHLAII